MENDLQEKKCMMYILKLTEMISLLYCVFLSGSKLRIKMEDNAFPFGAKFGADQYETIEEEWKYYFNYGQGPFLDIAILIADKLSGIIMDKSVENPTVKVLYK